MDRLRPPRPALKFGDTGLLGIETSLRCPISTGLLVNPLKARPCGHVYSKASAMSYFKGVGKRCAVFGCDKHLKWSDFVVDEASERALREYYRRQARTRQDTDDDSEDSVAPATTLGGVAAQLLAGQ